MPISSIVFYFSGAAIVSLFTLKSLEGKERSRFSILSFISRGDAWVRRLYRNTTYLYLEIKERSIFFVRKQIPLHTKNISNKMQVTAKAEMEKYIGNIRRSKLLKKSDGLSEYFRSISEVEKGNGEINDVYEEGSQER